MVGTPIATLVVERSRPTHIGVFLSHHPPVHPAVKWEPGLYRMDNCANHNILISGGPGTHTTNTAAQSVFLQVLPYSSSI